MDPDSDPTSLLYTDHMVPDPQLCPQEYNKVKTANKNIFKAELFCYKETEGEGGGRGRGGGGFPTAAQGLSPYFITWP